MKHFVIKHLSNKRHDREWYIFDTRIIEESHRRLFGKYEVKHGIQKWLARFSTEEEAKKFRQSCISDARRFARWYESTFKKPLAKMECLDISNMTADELLH